ncbi:hypothetical protein ACOLZ1_002904 [Vibrio fluvialis]
MRTLGYTSLIIGLLFSSAAFADIDKQQTLELLKKLQKQGISQSDTYQYADTEQLKQCVELSAPFREKAKQLQDSIKKSNDVIFRMPAYQAADLAFQCVYCSEQAISYCEKMDKYLARTEKAIK